MEKVLPEVEDALSGGTDPLLYNSRIIDTYIKLIKHKYSFVDINELIAYAGMEAYQVADQGHWFSQRQINLFYEKVLRETGNPFIAREAGQYAASPDAIGMMRQYVLGLVDPSTVYELIGKTTEKFVKSASYKSRTLSPRRIEITVTPRPGAKEEPFQCQNRIGFLEAISLVFNSKPPKIEHTECMFSGGKSCRYIISWDIQISSIWKKIRNLMILLIVPLISLLLILDTGLAPHYFFFMGFTALTLVMLIVESTEKKEIKASAFNLKESSDQLAAQIEINYNIARTTNEIGQTIANLTNKEDVLSQAIHIFEKRLDYDRGLILLADKKKSLLTFAAGFGYDHRQLEYIQKAAFHLENAQSKGVFVVSYKEKKPFLINDIKEIGNSLSKRSLAFAHQMGTQSFICCPIICAGKSIGILAVDNLRSKRPLVQSDLSLLMGISSIIGISISNADLLEGRQRQFGSILQVLAASIDARDPLTAGHSEKVTDYAMGICEALNLSTNYREMIRVASLLHDYGKIGVPDAILKKPGRLTQEEYEKVKTHAEKTQKILEQVNFEGIFSQVPEIAGSHHEKVDGSGYPNGLKGEEIPLGARIIAVADFFEAVTAKRHYRDPLPMGYAFRLLEKGRGVHFDEKIVDAFLSFYNKEIKEKQVRYPEKVIPMKKVC
jgi:HD-GYP domain-containing protein (c-di-GMP phosphodiesterase class II)